MKTFYLGRYISFLEYVCVNHRLYLNRFIFQCKATHKIWQVNIVWRSISVCIFIISYIWFIFRDTLYIILFFNTLFCNRLKTIRGKCLLHLFPNYILLKSHTPLINIGWQHICRSLKSKTNIWYVWISSMFLNCLNNLSNSGWSLNTSSLSWLCSVNK